MALPTFKLPTEVLQQTKQQSGWTPNIPTLHNTLINENTKPHNEEHKESEPTDSIQSSIDILSMFAPFNKSDRLGKISDFTQSDDRRQKRDDTTQNTDANDITFTYKQDRMEDNTFTLVDNRTSTVVQPKGKQFQRNNNRAVFRPNASIIRTGAMSTIQPKQGKSATTTQQQKPAWGNAANSTNLLSRASTGFGTQTTTARSGTINVSARQVAAQQRQAAYLANRNRRGYNYNQQIDVEEKPQSVNIEPNYTQLYEFSLNELNNAVSECSAVTDLTTAGTLKSYNTQYNRVTPRNPITLQRYDTKQFFTATTSEDTVLTQHIQQNTSSNTTVYGTDSIVSILMAANKTVYPWDIVIKKYKNTIVLDKRSSSKIDYITVGENVIYDSNDTSKQQITDTEHINYFENLALEATYINQNFSQQILNKDESIELEQPNPFIAGLQDGYEPAAVAYKYRSFKLGNYNLVVRCSLNAYTDTAGQQQYVISRALNEYDSKHSNTIDYRQRLESQTGAILASEMKHNMAKLTRWTAEAVLSGVEQVRLGFVSRLNNKNNMKHQILMTKLYTPSTLADSLSVKVRSLWGNVNAIVQQVQQQQDGTYLLIRDANKPALRLYSVPEDAFSDEIQDISTIIQGNTQQ